MPDFEPEAFLGYLVSRVAAAMRESLEARTRPLGLTAPQAVILLGRYAGIATTPAQFRRVHWVDPAAITRLLDQLERKGLIQRSPNPDDRRSVRIELTETGRDLAPLVHQAVRDNNARFVQLLSPEDHETVVASLQQILRYAGAGLRPHTASEGSGRDG